MKSAAGKGRLGVAIVVRHIDTTGGMERQALRLAERLVDRGARVWILSTRWSVVPNPLASDVVERRGRLTIYRVPLPRYWSLEGCDFLYELAIAGILSARAPALDAIYAVQWETAVLASRVARFLGCPVFVKFTGGGEYGDFSQIERSSVKEGALAELARADRLVCVSPQIAAEARAAGLSPDRCLAIPNGVDLARFEKARAVPLPGPKGAEHVLVVGALRREKRLPELVGAFETVARARPLAHLVIAGDGPEESAIRSAAFEAGLEGRVHLLGARGDVPGLLAAAKVFVLPSASEGLSNALLEALAAGTPVVATDIEGNRAVVEHEKEALLVPLGDPDTLARAVVRLLEDRELATRLARAGRAKVNDYDLEVVVGRYERIFRESARPLPGSLRLLVRFFGALAQPVTGRLGLGEPTLRLDWASVLDVRTLWSFLGIGAVRARDATTDVVVGTKRALGIEGKITARLGRRIRARI